MRHPIHAVTVVLLALVLAPLAGSALESAEIRGGDRQGAPVVTVAPEDGGAAEDCCPPAEGCGTEDCAGTSGCSLVPVLADDARSPRLQPVALVPPSFDLSVPIGPAPERDIPPPRG